LKGNASQIVCTLSSYETRRLPRSSPSFLELGAGGMKPHLVGLATVDGQPAPKLAPTAWIGVEQWHSFGRGMLLPAPEARYLKIGSQRLSWVENANPSFATLDFEVQCRRCYFNGTTSL
jgi:hypothetical protein